MGFLQKIFAYGFDFFKNKQCLASTLKVLGVITTPCTFTKNSQTQTKISHTRNVIWDFLWIFKQIWKVLGGFPFKKYPIRNNPKKKSRDFSSVHFLEKSEESRDLGSQKNTIPKPPLFSTVSQALFLNLTGQLNAYKTRQLGAYNL